MDIKELKRAVQNIKMSDEIRDHVIKNCQSEISAPKENTARKTSYVSRPAILIAAVICLGLAATVVAAGNMGLFKDIVRFDGAVVGTAYEQAPGEIEASAAVAGSELTVTAVITKEDILPYRELENLGIDSFRVVDSKGNAVFKGGRTEMYEIDGGKAEIKISLPDIAAGSYQAIIDAFVGGKKADQTLLINGEWECEFTV